MYVIGVRNLTALSSLIKWQKLEFNFNFYHHEYLTDLDIVVLSEGKSLLPVSGASFNNYYFIPLHQCVKFCVQNCYCVLAV